MNVLDSVVQEYIKSDIPAFGVGDTVKVHVKIKEGNRERIQIFEGFVLKRQNGGIGETFTVRRIASGVGVEKTFPIHSPLVEKIEVVRKKMFYKLCLVWLQMSIIWSHFFEVMFLYCPLE